MASSYLPKGSAVCDNSLRTLDERKSFLWSSPQYLSRPSPQFVRQPTTLTRLASLASKRLAPKALAAAAYLELHLRSFLFGAGYVESASAGPERARGSSRRVPKLARRASTAGTDHRGEYQV